MRKPIKSDNENAIAELKAKAEKLRERQEEMKKANEYFRKNCTMKGYADWTDEQAAQMDAEIQEAYSWNKQPYPAYELTNNNKNLRGTELRIKLLEQELKERAAARTYDTEKFGFEVYENTEISRLQLYFDGKPEEAIREQLKGRGFHYSPTNECWQRLLNNNARLSLDSFIRFMERHQSRQAEAT